MSKDNVDTNKLTKTNQVKCQAHLNVKNIILNKLTKTNQVECHAHSPLPDIATAIFGPANWVTDLIEVIINKQTNKLS